MRLARVTERKVSRGRHNAVRPKLMPVLGTEVFVEIGVCTGDPDPTGAVRTAVYIARTISHKHVSFQLGEHIGVTALGQASNCSLGST